MMLARVWHRGVFAARVRKLLRTGELSFLAEPRVRKLMKTLEEDFPTEGAGKLALKSAKGENARGTRIFFLEAAGRF